MCFEDADFVYKDPLLFQNDNDPVVTVLDEPHWTALGWIKML